MPRIARVVIPGFPHHVVQRGNRRQPTFFSDGDYRYYIDLLAEWTFRCGVEVWVYCLMTNHVHLIVRPSDVLGLRKAIGETHQRYTRRINVREGWRGHLWQGRFASYPLDERYLLAAARYVELNPVKAGMVRRPEDYPWSSARFHLRGGRDPLIKKSPILQIAPAWREFLKQPLPQEQADLIEKHEKTGRPLGDQAELNKLERLSGRKLRRAKPGRKWDPGVIHN